MPRKIMIVTDAWSPQVNGVVTTLKGLCRTLTEQGHIVSVAQPEQYRTIPMPRYSEIRLAINTWKLRKKIEQFKPDSIHIATEGPLGIYARNYCAKRNIPYTTSYHTNFPEFISAFTKLPAKWFYPFMRWMHKHASSILVTTPTMCDHLTAHGFKNLVVWNRAVDTELYDPKKSTDVFDHLPHPIWLNVTRVSPEKNIPAFLDLPLEGTKVVVGDGPIFEKMSKQYPDVVWTGVKHGEELAQHYASASYFVFPSCSDTFGVVMLEAMASGLPVAAYPVTGPIDVVVDGVNGYLRDDLLEACDKVKADPTLNPRKHVEHHHTADAFAQIFVDTLVDIHH